MERRTLFVDVVLPLSLPNYFTYRVPFELNEFAEPGKRVIVPFGKTKFYSALIRKVHETPPAGYVAKYIDSILDERPVVSEKQFLFWEWMAFYYMCHPGDVMNAALPSGLKLSSDTRYAAATGFEGREGELSDIEFLVMEALRSENTMGLKEIASVTGLKSPYRLVRNMVAKGAILPIEEIKERFRPKTEVFVRLAEEWKGEEKLKELFEKLEKRAPKQCDLLTNLVRLGGMEKEVRRKDLLDGGDASSFTSLVKKGVFSVSEKETGRFADTPASRQPARLSDTQAEALARIKASFKSNQVSLLHGVTSSGKTEIYVHLIQETLKEGRQVLYLIPEIAITAQLVDRLRSVLGNAVGVYHSRFNENERVEVWNGVLGFQSRQGQDPPRFSIITGARSALFLPWTELGLVIIDEEHDHSFKQQDPAPRYHARDAAIWLARQQGAKVLLGSATPSMESWHNADTGKYGRISLNERHGGILLPEIHLVDMKKEWKEKKNKGHFSEALVKAIGIALAHEEQVILFQNRRGFAPVLECSWCAWVPACLNCDVSLVYHKSSGQLRCHYCGYSIPSPKTCSACGDSNLKLKGFGTEQIEEEISLLFPGTETARLDLDTTRSRYAHYRIIHEFSEGKIKILTGTQMVTKGLDFDRVTLVGILDADGLLRFPDFRSHERAFALMEQVAGRAGRRSKRGNVIIQARDTGHPVLKHLLKHDYLALCREELSQREKLHFPPFVRMMEFMLSHTDADKVDAGSMKLASIMKEVLGGSVMGPESPLIARVRNRYRKKIILRTAREDSMSATRKKLFPVLQEFQRDPTWKGILVQVNVDPL